MSSTHRAGLVQYSEERQGDLLMVTDLLVETEPIPNLMLRQY